MADRRRLDELATEIESLECTLAERRAKHAVIRASLVYPVITLPAELVSAIFLRCIPPTRRRSYGPFDPPEALVRRHMDTARTWLARSGSLPLSIYMKRNGIPGSDTVLAVWREAFAMIWAHRARWEYADIDVVRQDSIELDAFLPLLRGLRVSSFMLSTEPPTGVVRCCFEAPLLQTVHGWFGATAQYLLDRVVCARLRQIKLEHVGPIMVARLLECMPHLTRGWLDLWNPCDEGEQGIPAPESLPSLDHLDTLIIEIPGDCPRIDELLALIAAPNLTRLSFEHNDRPDTDEVQHLAGLIRRMGCRSKLQRLCVTGDANEVIYGAEFKDVPNIKYSRAHPEENWGGWDWILDS
ncbi:F-box domain-containing protein [Mycena kentingensis (nom. inval.)]|nr:F-box domain-containing protein [Mycena kentingensis (nom. inval.)]